MSRIMDTIRRRQEEKKKEKTIEFKIPFKYRFAGSGIAKKNKALVIYLYENGNLDFVLGQIKDGIITLPNGSFYNSNKHLLFTYKGKIPTMVIPQWDIQGICTKEYYDHLGLKQGTNYQQILIRMYETKLAQDAKKGFAMSWIIWVLLGGIGIAVLLFGDQIKAMFGG